MAFAGRFIESFKEKESKKGKKFLAVKIVDLGWASCWDTKCFAALKAAAANGTEIKVDISQSEKTDDQGNPFLNVDGVWTGDDEGGGPAEDPGAEGAAAAPPRPAAPPAPAPRPAGPPGPGGIAGGATGRAPADGAQTRAFVCLAAAMLAWGGAIAKTPPEVVRWIGIFDEYVKKDVLPKVPEV